MISNFPCHKFSQRKLLQYGFQLVLKDLLKWVQAFCSAGIIVLAPDFVGLFSESFLAGLHPQLCAVSLLVLCPRSVLGSDIRAVRI